MTTDLEKIRIPYYDFDGLEDIGNLIDGLDKYTIEEEEVYWSDLTEEEIEFIEKTTGQDIDTLENESGDDGFKSYMSPEADTQIYSIPLTEEILIVYRKFDY